MFEEAISLLSIWASMNTWLTPTVLFLLLNLMIGTIAVTSGFTSHKPAHHHHPEPTLHHHHHHHHLQQPQPQIQTHLTRSPSVLQRIKSINFSTFHFQHPPQQPNPTPGPKPEPEIEPNSSTSSSSSSSDDDESPTLDEIYSLIKQENSNPHYGRQSSDTKPSGGEIPVKLPQKMKKSASDKSAFNHFQFQEGQINVPTPEETVEEDVEEERENAAATMVKEEREDDGVDAKADDFINRFRKQLQLQRKDSILRYKEMVSRTSAQ